jgi:hypothetical protein
MCCWSCNNLAYPPSEVKAGYSYPLSKKSKLNWIFLDEMTREKQMHRSRLADSDCLLLLFNFFLEQTVVLVLVHHQSSHQEKNIWKDSLSKVVISLS